MKLQTILSDYLLSPKYYRLINLVIFIIYFVPSGFNIENIPMKLTFGWGLMIITYDVLTKRKLFRQPYWIILVLLSVSYLISVILNFPYQFPDTIYNWGYLLISLFIFYVFNPEEKIERVNKHMQLFNDIFIYITFVLGTIALILFIFNIAYRVPAGLGTFSLRQGFIGNRLFGLYTSPNIGSMFGYVSVILMLVNNHFKRGSWKSFQTLYVINGIVQYCFFILSKSRGTELTLYGLGAMVFIVSVLISWKRNSLWKSVKYWGIRVAIALLLFFSVSNTIETVLSYIPSTVDILQYEATKLFNGDTDSENVDNNEESDESEITEEETDAPNFSQVKLRPDEEGGELTSGRLSIWMGGIALVQQSPLFGVADADIYRGIESTNQIDESQLSKLDISELKRASGNMHSTYVAVLVKAGIVGFIILTIFVVLMLKDNIKYLLSEKFNIKHSDDQLYVLIFVFLLSLFVNDVVENHLIMNNRDVMGLVFWSYLGYLNYIRIKRRKEEGIE